MDTLTEEIEMIADSPVCPDGNHRMQPVQDTLTLALDPYAKPAICLDCGYAEVNGKPVFVLTQERIRAQLYENDEYYRAATDALAKRMRRGNILFAVVVGLAAIAGFIISNIYVWHR